MENNELAKTEGSSLEVQKPIKSRCYQEEV